MSNETGNESFSAAEMEVSTPAVRRAIYNARRTAEEGLRRISMFVIVFATLLVGGMLFLNWQTQANSARVGEVGQRLETGVNSDRSLANQLETIRLQQQRDYNELVARLATAEARTQQPVAASTLVPVVVVPATPVPTPVEKFAAPKVVDFKGMRAGSGAFRITVEAPKDPSSGPYTKEEAQSQVAAMLRPVRSVCLAGGERDFSTYALIGAVGYAESSGGRPLSEDCWRILQNLAGVVVSDKLSPTAVSALKVLKGLGRLNLFVQENGRIIGFWREWTKPQELTCVERGLKLAGWDGTPYFVVDRFAPGVWDILYGEMMDRALGSQIPDLCSPLRSTTKPGWVEYSYVDDAHVLTVRDVRFGDMEVTIHTDPDRCQAYPSSWPKGQNLFEVKTLKTGLVKVALADPNTLIMLGWSQSVFLTVDGRKINWYVPQSLEGGYYPLRPSIGLWFSPMVDGVSSWIWVSQDPMPYVLVDGQVIPQSKPEKLN